MANQKSDQITDLETVPIVKVAAQDATGRVRHIRFSKTLTSNLAIGETLELCKVPRGARIIGGHAAWEAMTTGAGAATMELGDGTTANKYLEATSVDAAGASDFADTLGRNYGELVANEFTLTATASVEAWASGQAIAGHILVVTD